MSENQATAIPTRQFLDTLHQEVLDQLEGIRERNDSLRREMQQGFADLRKLIVDHWRPMVQLRRGGRT